MKFFFVFSLLTLSLLLLGSLVVLTTKDLLLTNDLVASEQAYYLAQAGLQRATDQHASDPEWRGEWKNVILGAGAYTVRVYDQNGQTIVESTGIVNRARYQTTRTL